MRRRSHGSCVSTAPGSRARFAQHSSGRRTMDGSGHLLTPGANFDGSGAFDRRKRSLGLRSTHSLSHLWPSVPLALLSAVLLGASAPFPKLLLGAVSPQLVAGLLYLGAGGGRSCRIAPWPGGIRHSGSQGSFASPQCALAGGLAVERWRCHIHRVRARRSQSPRLRSSSGYLAIS